ncbi:bud site selection protein 20 [Nematocida homosporus]|uniref:bud site selection protein 20 n=1 Tax=Nematocida homosporus TaxID=1912981 RepID=UPI00221FC0D1|nr:bud site selection protein 20 [Nematocida homosporus]KAI5185246.1 bud site selection protein 20 [Nematocida homosporus]
MSRRKPSKSTNSRKAVHREISRSCKLKNRKQDLDQIRKFISVGAEPEPLENPNNTRCLECDRVMEISTLDKHRQSRGHKRRLKELEQDALLEEDRRNGLF